MATHDEIERDQYAQIHGLAERVNVLTGVVEASNNINLELISILKKVLVGAFIIITLLIFALIFGALGERGFHAVTDRIPLPSADPIVSNNDFDKYTSDTNHNKGKTKC